MNMHDFWTELETVLGIATKVLPAVAAANTANNPASSNTGVNNVAKAVALVTPLVHAGDTLSDSAHPMTGAQKLDNALQAVSAAVTVGASVGLISQPYAAFVPIISSAIEAAIQVRDAQAAPQNIPPAPGSG